MVSTERFNLIIDEIYQEFKYATSKFPPFTSGHEGVSILREEFEELWDSVRSAKDSRKMALHARYEAIQVATMAIRFILDLFEK